MPKKTRKTSKVTKTVKRVRQKPKSVRIKGRTKSIGVSRFVKRIQAGPTKVSIPKVFGAVRKIFDTKKGRIIKPAKPAAAAKSATPTYTKSEVEKWRTISKRGGEVLKARQMVSVAHPEALQPKVKLTEELMDYLKVGRKGPFDLLEIELTNFGRSTLKNWKKTLDIRRYQQILQFFAIELRKIRSNLAAYGQQEILRYVPRDVGNLRISLRRSLAETASVVPRGIPTPSGLKLRMGFNSELEYAEIVNVMSNKSLRHFGNKRSWRTGKMLYDPTATTHFMSLIRLHLRSKAKKLVIGMIKNMTPNVGLSYNLGKRMFKVKHIGRY